MVRSVKDSQGTFSFLNGTPQIKKEFSRSSYRLDPLLQVIELCTAVHQLWSFGINPMLTENLV